MLAVDIETAFTDPCKDASQGHSSPRQPFLSEGRRTLPKTQSRDKEKPRQGDQVRPDVGQENGDNLSDVEGGEQKTSMQLPCLVVE